MPLECGYKTSAHIWDVDPMVSNSTSQLGITHSISKAFLYQLTLRTG
jgi:hypothetical protein